jgi:serine protease AprX
MERPENNKWLDEALAETIGSEKPLTDFDKWKQQHPEAVKMLTSRAGKKASPALLKTRRIIMTSTIVKLAAAAAILILVIIGMDNINTNGSSVAWADVMERFESVPFFSVTVYTGHGRSLEGKVEIWKSEGSRIRAHEGNKVIFAGLRTGDTIAFDRSTRQRVDHYGIATELLETTLRPQGSDQRFSLDTLIDHFPMRPEGITPVETPDTPASKETVLFEARHESSAERLFIWALRGSKLPIRMRFYDSKNGEYGDFFFDYSEKKDDAFFDPEAFKNSPTNEETSSPSSQGRSGTEIGFTEDIKSPDLVIQKVMVSEIGDKVVFTVQYDSEYQRRILFFNPPDKDIIDIVRVGIHGINPGHGVVSIPVEKEKLKMVDGITIMFTGHGDNCIFLDWPPYNLPADFDRNAATQWGMDPGLGISSLHEQGIDGRGIHVAIIDLPLLEDHVEYKEQLVQYTRINCDNAEPDMHGAAVASLFVGDKCGVAPRALLHFWAVPSEADYKHRNEALQQIINYNEGKPLKERIRAVSVSKGFSSDEPNLAHWKELLKKAEDKGIYVIHCGDMFGIGCPVNSDKNDPKSYEVCSFAKATGQTGDEPNTIFVPVDNRTSAHSKDVNAYIFWSVGGFSWGAPYIAGVAALGLQVDPYLTPRQIRDYLLASGTPFHKGVILNPPEFIRYVKRMKRQSGPSPIKPNP